MPNPDRRISFASLALALANDYVTLYVIHPEDDSYVEYAPNGQNKELVEVSRGDNFYLAVPDNCRKLVWPEDQEAFLKAFKKEHVIDAVENGRSFSLTYRLTLDGDPQYFNLKTIRSPGGEIIVGVRNIDEEKRKELEAERASATYEQVAGALASRYEVIYLIDLETDDYIIYSASRQYNRLGTTKKGGDFFADAAADIRKYIHPDDVSRILERVSKDRLLRDLQHNGTTSFSYRQMLNDKFRYMNMFVVQPKNDHRHIVIGVMNTDAQVRREQSIREQNRNFSDIALALAQQYEAIYMINVLTDEYAEYSAGEQYKKLKIGMKGEDFFADTMRNMQCDIYPDDLPMMEAFMRKDNLLATLSSAGKAFINYRLMIDGEPQYATLHAFRPKEDSEHIIITVANINAAMQMELAYHDAMDMASRDALTGVKNKRAYVQMETDLDLQIRNGSQPPFALVVCDMNGLKKVNDTQGHQAGDDFIRNTCSILCNIFLHSPVFRIGGDEFSVLLKDRDYLQRDQLIQQLGRALDQQLIWGIRPLAVGVADFEPGRDLNVQDVFERADRLMYQDKVRQKAFWAESEAKARTDEIR